MKSAKYILLVIGILAIAATIYNLIQGKLFTDQIITLVCGASLIYGYFELTKA
jgi:hypothetical protein